MGPNPVSRYNDLVMARPGEAGEQASRLYEAFSAEGIRYGTEPMASFLRPHFVPERAWRELASASRRLLELSARLARQAFSGDVMRLCEALGTPEGEAQLVAIDTGGPDVLLSRLDAFLTPEGPRFIEVNSDAPAGFGYSDRMARVFTDLPSFQAFSREYRVRYPASANPLARALLAEWRRRGGVGSPRVAIVDFSGVKTRPDQEILRQAFGECGVPCALEDPRDLGLREGRLVGRSGVVDLVYRRALLQELLADEPAVSEFLRGYREQAFACCNSFRCRLSEDKAFLALLHDGTLAPFMSPDEIGFLRHYVPPTLRVADGRAEWKGKTIDVVPFVLENREELVLKPAHAYGGDSVHLGAEAEPAAWEAAVLRSLRTPFVVQERVEIPEEDFPVLEGGAVRIEARKVNVNPFYVYGAESGCVARASRSAVINVSAGGGSVPTFIVSDGDEE